MMLQVHHSFFEPEEKNGQDQKASSTCLSAFASCMIVQIKLDTIIEICI